jgi:hypothetical protein
MVHADEVVDSFTPDASYRSSVFREPFLGSAAIRGTGSAVPVRSVRSPSTWAPIITDDRVAVEWWTTMIDPDESEITLPGGLLQVGEAQRRIVVPALRLLDGYRTGQGPVP